MKNLKQILLQASMLSMALVALGACSSNSSQPVVQEVVIQQPDRRPPGVVEYTWEEPVVDVIEVPAGLDPEGVYYMPAHQSTVEIRQGRWKYQRDPAAQR